MSIELHVFLQDSLVPSLETWQREIERLQFPTVIESPFDLRRDTGFQPASYKEQPAGFEFYLDAAADILSSYPRMKLRIGNRDKCATFRWRSELLECAAALSAAAAITRLTDGVYFYPDDDIIYGADDVVDATRMELRSI